MIIFRKYQMLSLHGYHWEKIIAWQGSRNRVGRIGNCLPIFKENTTSFFNPFFGFHSNITVETNFAYLVFTSVLRAYFVVRILVVVSLNWLWRELSALLMINNIPMLSDSHGRRGFKSRSSRTLETCNFEALEVTAMYFTFSETSNLFLFGQERSRT